MMDEAEVSMGNASLQSPLLGYTEHGISDMSISNWIWMALILAAVLSFWRLRGIKDFYIGFAWSGNHPQLEVMLQSSSSSFYGSVYNEPRKTESAIPSDDPNTCRNMYMDDLEILTYRKQALDEKRIHRRFEKNSNSKSSFTSETSIDCNTYDSDSLCNTSFLEAEMLILFEKSVQSLSLWTLPESVPVSPLGNQYPKQQLRFPSWEKRECLTANFGSTSSRHNNVRLVEELRGRTIHGPIQDKQGNYSVHFSSSQSNFDVETRDKWKGNWFVYNHGSEELLGERLCLMTPSIWPASFENQYGWDKVLSIKSGFAGNHCRGKAGLNAHRFPKYFFQDLTVKLWWVGNGPKLMKFQVLAEDVLSSIDNAVHTWDIDVAKWLNEPTIKDIMFIGNHIQDAHESLFSGIVTREQNTSLIVWDSRIFVKPVSFRLANKIRFQSLQLADKKLHLSYELKNTILDLRMLGA